MFFYFVNFVRVLVCAVFLFRIPQYAEAVSLSAAKVYLVSEQKLALEGFDPMTYVEGAPRKGEEKYFFSYQGNNYNFVSSKNLKTFASNPEKYKPAFGGYCALAMQKGAKIEPNVLNYRIVEGKLLLFYKTYRFDAHKLWLSLINKGVNELDLVKEAEMRFEKLQWED